LCTRFHVTDKRTNKRTDGWTDRQTKGHRSRLYVMWQRLNNVVKEFIIKAKATCFIFKTKFHSFNLIRPRFYWCSPILDFTFLPRDISVTCQHQFQLIMSFAARSLKVTIESVSAASVCVVLWRVIVG